jgi:excisionase family DNA binding protein
MKNTFEQLPEMVAELIIKVNSIETLLLTKSETAVFQETDQLYTIEEAGRFLNLSISTIYGLVNKKTIPVCKRGKRLYFSKHELFDWVKTSRRQTVNEVSVEVNSHLAILYNK